MPVSKAQQKAVYKYSKNKYDRIMYNATKGTKDAIRQQIDTGRGTSINSYIDAAVQAKLAEDNKREVNNNDN